MRLANDLGPVQATDQIYATVHFAGHNEAAFHAAVDALYNPTSSSYHKWMKNEDLARYAPTKEEIAAVTKELKSHGLTITSSDLNGFSLRVYGAASKMEEAFNTKIHFYTSSNKVFRATSTEPKLTGEAAKYISFVSGLENHQVHPLIKRAVDQKTKQPYASIPLKKVEDLGGFDEYITNTIFTAPTTETFMLPNAPLPVAVYYGNYYNINPNTIPGYSPAQLQSIYGLTDAYKQGLTGKGQTIVLLEAYGYPTIQADANAFATLAGLPQLTSSNFSIVYPEGKPVSSQAGILLGWDGEIALDVQWAHAMAPSAKIVVAATAGQSDNDFEDAISYIADHDLGNTVSCSWETDVDLITGPAEHKAFEAVLEIAAAKGISVNFSTGDDGDKDVGTPEKIFPFTDSACKAYSVICRNASASRAQSVTPTGYSDRLLHRD